ncbi:MAG: DnaJ domain-containing protein [Syntrophales bacterium]|nr:DnaJ domain-containing protein [Syntrophales bacterium]
MAYALGSAGVNDKRISPLSETSPSVPEIFNACTQLFGKNVQISVDFLNYLEPSSVRAAYRERAFETHPDRARVLGVKEEDLADTFKKINKAYEILSFAVRKENKLILLNGNLKSERSARTKTKTRDTRDHYYSGNLPGRHLPIGRFLYYSGLISWRALIESIIWQRKNRPLIGAIARSWKYLTDEEVIHILRNKAAEEKFGEYALRSGLLTKGNLMALLGKQRMLNRPLGEYFIMQGMLRSSEVEDLVRAQRRHNAIFTFSRFGMQ